MSDLPNVHRADSSPFLTADAVWEERDDHGWLVIPGARYCSYCGSVDPETFVKLCEPGAAKRLEVADWKYGWPHKVYIDVASPDPDRLTYIGGRYEAKEGAYAKGGSEYRPPGPDEIPMADLTPEQIEILKRDGAWGVEEEELDEPDPLRYYRFGTRDTIHQKFYTVHLKDLGASRLAEVADLIELRTGIVFRIVGEKLMWRGFKAPLGL